MENEKSTGNKYTVKDAAIIGIFCAVMFVVFMVYSILTGASLFYSMIFNAAGAALILAPFYVYMCMKVGKHGPALVYNIMWAIIAGLMMGPFMIPWFLGGGIIAELSMCGKDAYHDIKRVSISWVITALVRAAHGMSEIWFFKDAFLATGVSEQQVQVQTQYYTDPKYVILSLAVTAIDVYKRQAPEKMTVLVVEPRKEPYVKEIDPGLHSLQAEVGGDIGATYPFSDPVALVCNDEGKLIGLDLNRGLRDETGEIYDIIDRKSVV